MAQRSVHRPLRTAKERGPTNRRSGMLTDEYGLAALLESVRVAEAHPDRPSLVLGSDLSTLGVDISSPENLYPVFGGPWGETPGRLNDTDCRIPSEYVMDQGTRTRVAAVKMDRYGIDVLFFVFYTSGGDARQIQSAAELYKRGWRFHKDEGVWINLSEGSPVETKWTYERGTYAYFDPINWKEDKKEFLLMYDRLEDEPPSIPAPSASREPTGPGAENPD
ncbi:hypothetical protein HPB48_018703 [Haemaphysalis longicornis]|uniref:NOT2/NOT3/NOT5 C-terminal domain-containing protein n=1 Tax=Haemaphysalis longicornis TaxID=44386 RepID=A0A9J6G180_HAELO|nr:hypothetical protein HPB48_018703 [Haemaphysalis longicornis]